ncbi:MAG: DDE-type integrase/transposase/recombinase, partial [Rhodoglobus sp.]
MKKVDNFPVWKVQFASFLEILGLVRCILNKPTFFTIPESAIESATGGLFGEVSFKTSLPGFNEKIALAELEDYRFVFAALRQALQEVPIASSVLAVIPQPNAPLAWSTLLQRIYPQNTITLQTELMKLQAMTQGSDSLEAFCARYLEQIAKLTALGHKLEETMLILSFLRGLKAVPDYMKDYARALPTLPQVQAYLIQTAQAHQFDKKGGEKSNTEAAGGFAANASKPGNCAWCGKPGHWISECKSKLAGKPQVVKPAASANPAASKKDQKKGGADKKDGKSTCEYCGKIGHTAEICRKKKADAAKGDGKATANATTTFLSGNPAGAKAAGQFAQARTAEPAFTVEDGYETEDCANSDDDEYTAPDLSTPSRPARSEEPNLFNEFFYKQPAPPSAPSANAARASTAKPAFKEKYVLDTGTTHHMVPASVPLQEVGTTEIIISTAGHEEIKNPDVGVLSALTQDGNHVKFTGVLSSDKLSKKLLSVSQIVSNPKYEVLFDKNGAIVREKGPNGKVVLVADAENGMFVISLHETHSLAEAQTLYSSAKDVELWRLLHKRLGHPGESIARRLVQRGSVRGLPSTYPSLEKCESCVIGKMAQRPVPTERPEHLRPRLPFDEVQIDLTGPVDTPSMSGAVYQLTIVDVATQYYSVVPCKTKREDEVAPHIIKWIEQNRAVVGHYPRILNSDNGPEFANKTLENYCGKVGTKQRFAPPYYPPGNSAVERAHGIIGNRILTWRFDSKAPKWLWAEFAIAAAQVHNLSVPDDATGMVPLQKFKSLKDKPSVDWLRAIGCNVVYRIQPKQSGKLNLKGGRGILVGYAPEGSTGYRILYLLS